MSEPEVRSDATRPRHGLNHALDWPEHDLFTQVSKDAQATPWIILSGPSRMGNHLLLSLLDGHPEIPSVPGEDGILSFGFARAAQDPGAFRREYLEGRDQSNDPWAALRRLSTNGHFDKWARYAHDWHPDLIASKPSGVATTEIPAVFDFRGHPPKIDFGAFTTALDKSLGALEASPGLADVIYCYAIALKHLFAGDGRDVLPRYRAVLCHSGMRTQALWALQTFNHVRLVASLRPFDSYAPSHALSRYGTAEVSEPLLSEAWSHWHSKIEDYLSLKSRFPDRVHLLSYAEVTTDTGGQMAGLMKDLGLPWSNGLTTATIGGQPVGGNAAEPRIGSPGQGTVYSDGRKLDPDRVPRDADGIWRRVMAAAVTPEATNRS